MPIDDSAFHLPPELLALFGTPVWEAMDETRRIEYSRHEAAAVLGAGIWFENALMQIVLRHLARDRRDRPDAPLPARSRSPTSAGTRRCSASSSAVPARPSYGPDRPVLVDGSTCGRALGYLLVLAVEEQLDHINRLTMRDARVHPVSRQIAKLHVLEEARHVSFAKTYLAEIWPTLDDDDRETVTSAAPELVAEIVSLTLDPTVFEHLDIPDGAATARANPHHRANVIAGLAKLTSFLDELGVITDRPRWSELGLVDAA